VQAHQSGVSERIHWSRCGNHRRCSVRADVAVAAGAIVSTIHARFVVKIAGVVHQAALVRLILATRRNGGAIQRQMRGRLRMPDGDVRLPSAGESSRRKISFLRVDPAVMQPSPPCPSIHPVPSIHRPSLPNRTSLCAQPMTKIACLCAMMKTAIMSARCTWLVWSDGGVLLLVQVAAVALR